MPRRVTRAHDLAARYGGEEFAVQPPPTDAEAARAFAGNGIDASASLEENAAVCRQLGARDAAVPSGRDSSPEGRFGVSRRDAKCRRKGRGEEGEGKESDSNDPTVRGRATVAVLEAISALRTPRFLLCVSA